MNFATELRAAFTDGVKEVLAARPDTHDPKKLGAAGMQKVKAIVKGRIRVCGCEGKAGRD